MSPRAELAKLIKDLEKDPGLYERISPSEWPPLQLFLPKTRRPRHTLFVTKGAVLTRLLVEQVLPRDTVILYRCGLPTDEYLREVSSRLDRARHAVFLGDLDPLDLQVYLTLAHGALPPKSKPRLKLRYGGINDACLGFCERNLKKGQRLETRMIRMSGREQRHFAILDSMVDVAAIIGERSRDLLRSGLKFELEGATDAPSFKKGHLASLLRVTLGA